MASTASAAQLIKPIRSEPRSSAVLLDVDGTVAPIVRHAADAQVPPNTHELLRTIARQYGLLAFVSGRQASEARRIVGVGSATYIGGHGSELLRAGTTATEIDPEVAKWSSVVSKTAHRLHAGELRRLRVRLEDKGAIWSFHWRGVPDEQAAERAVNAAAAAAESEGLRIHRGRMVVELRPPTSFDKGSGLRSVLLASGVKNAIYAGDDATDIDAFRCLDDLLAEGHLAHALKVGVQSPEGPPELSSLADVTVDGTDGMRQLLAELATPDSVDAVR